MIKVLSVASECAPLIKTGGLADVAGALPSAMIDRGCEMRTLLPGYPAVLEALGKKSKTAMEVPDCFGGPARIKRGKVKGLDIYVLDAPHLFDRPGAIYVDTNGVDYEDNPERFAALSWVAAQIGAAGIGRWKPKILHLHDWQAGLAPVYLRKLNAGHDIRTVLTIHNIAFHGIAPANRLAALKLPASGFAVDGFEFWGKISALKAGLAYSDALTTVSPTYANELATPEFGMGLDGIIRQRREVLTGILNGIDENIWNPATDALIAAPYKTARGKAKNRAAILAEMELNVGDGPLCVVVSRLTEQKGLDLLLEALPALVDRGGALALLGSGDASLEKAWTDAAKHPNVAVRIGYDEALSHRLIAGGDAILVPSRFEPCGLTQLYGLRYGSVPLVAHTGGLADTIIPANDAGLRAGVATGIQFAPVTSDALAQALIKLCELYSQADVWAKLQRNAMRHRVDWSASAGQYANLYRNLINRT